MALLGATSALPARTFTVALRTDAPLDQRGESGASFQPRPLVDVDCVLASDVAPAGVESWNLAVVHTPGTLELIRVGFDGTDLERQLGPPGAPGGGPNGFASIEIVDPELTGRPTGFIVSAVFPDVAFELPPDGAVVVRATYRGTHPEVIEESTSEARVDVAPRIVGKTGPVETEIVHLGRSVMPRVRPLVFTLRTLPTCNAGVALSVRAPGSVDVTERRELRTRVRPAGAIRIEADVVLTVDVEGDEGPQGWSISVRHDADPLELDSVTVAGTDVGALFPRSFNRTEIIDVDGPAGRKAGLVSVVILSFDPFDPSVALPPAGSFSIARASYVLRPGDVPSGVVVTGDIWFEDGLQGENQGLPVENIVTLRGESERACRKSPLHVEVSVEDFSPRPRARFLRADVSGDGRVNVSDAVWLLRALFRNVVVLACDAAADANADLAVDVSDAIFLLGFLFQRAPRPPSPFPACGDDPVESNPIPCAAGCEDP